MAKIRTGFVSNSSSSSFVMFVKKEDYDRIYETLSNLEKDIIDFVTRDTSGLGLQLKRVGFVGGNYSTFEDYTYDKELTEDEEERMNDLGAECIMDDILGKFKDIDTLNHSEDF